MLYQIKPPQTSKLKKLCEPLSYHLVLNSILDGNTPGKIFTDHPTAPQALFATFKHHAFFIGLSSQPAFQQALASYFNQCAAPQARAEGQAVFLFDISPSSWSTVIDQLLPGRSSRRYLRQYFFCQTLHEDYRKLLPAGFEVKQITPNLLKQKQLDNLPELREEMCSERVSVEDFLEHSFGYVIQQDNHLVAWALSEYNTADRCEVGIATDESYRRMGFGTIVALALLEHAFEHGYHTVGWHCWANNLASAALARRAGFQHQLDYAVDLLQFLDP